jgi:hypothetical protein
MTNEQIQQYREIVENAPKGATHYGYNEYLKAEGFVFMFYDGNCWDFGSVDSIDAEDLENLRTIVEQHDELQAKDKRISDLERGLNEMLHTVANQYNGDDNTEWSVGANHVVRLFGKYVVEQLRKQQG